VVSIIKYLKYLFLFLFIYCGNTKTDLSDVEIIFDNNLMLFTKNSKPYSGRIIELHENKQIKIVMTKIAFILLNIYLTSTNDF